MSVLYTYIYTYIYMYTHTHTSERPILPACRVNFLF